MGETDKEEEQIRRTKTKKGMEKRKYSAERKEERDKHNNRNERGMDYRIIVEEEGEMECKIKLKQRKGRRSREQKEQREESDTKDRSC